MRVSIEEVAMHPGVKVLVRFSRRFWDPRAEYFLLDNPLIPVVWTVPAPVPILTAFTTGPRVHRLAEPPGPVDRVVDEIASVWGEAVRSLVVEAELVGWGADQRTRGGYSSDPPGASRRGPLSCRSGPLLFAGEATDDRSPGTVSGALRSGRRAAAAALEGLAYDS